MSPAVSVSRLRDPFDDLVVAVLRPWATLGVLRRVVLRPGRPRLYEVHVAGVEHGDAGIFERLFALAACSGACFAWHVMGPEAVAACAEPGRVVFESGDGLAGA